MASFGGGFTYGRALGLLYNNRDTIRKYAGKWFDGTGYGPRPRARGRFPIRVGRAIGVYRRRGRMRGRRKWYTKSSARATKCGSACVSRVRGGIGTLGTHRDTGSFPDWLPVTFNWVSTSDVGLTPSTISPAGFVVNMNSLYRPSELVMPADNHSPLGFDQIAALYSHYSVWGADVRVTFTPTSSANDVWGVCYLDTNTAVISNHDAILETSGVKKVFIPRAVGANSKAIIIRYRHGQFWGNRYRDDVGVKSVVAGHPNKKCRLHIAATNANTSATIQIRVTVEVRFFGHMRDPLKVSYPAAALAAPGAGVSSTGGPIVELPPA